MLFSEIAGLLAALLLILFHKRLHINNAYAFFGIWSAVCLFEYYFLGSNSYIHMDEEGDLYPPYYLYLLEHHLGGQFGHGIAGGGDVYTTLSPNIQQVSPELMWFQIFPVWIAILVHKSIIAVAGFLGSYWLCRHTTKADVFICAACAALFTVSTHNLMIATYSVGAGLSLLPLALYTLVARAQETAYWRYTLPTIAVTAIYMDPTHNTEPVFAGLVFATILLSRLNRRIIAALLLLLALMILNWGGSLYAMLQIAPFSQRSQISPLEVSYLTKGYEALHQLWVYVTGNLITLAPLVGVAVLWWRKDPLRYRATIAVFGILISFLFLLVFPFDAIGLGVVGKISHHYILLALTGLMLPVLAQAANQCQTYISSRQPVHVKPHFAAALIMAAAVGSLTYFKVYNFGSLFYHGGQSQYFTIDTVMSKAWRPKEPLRVMTLRTRDLGPEPGLAQGTFGLEPIDQFQMLESKNKSLFFNLGLRKGAEQKVFSDARLFIDWDRWKGGAYHGFAEQYSLDLLRLANVGFILTPVPFANDSGLTRVAGPETAPLTKFERSGNMGRYLKERIARLDDFTELYIYALADPYPQVFAATRILGTPNNPNPKSLIETISRSAREAGRAIVAEQTVAARLGTANTSLRVQSFTRVRDGYDVQVDAPEGGILVLNTQYMPFWSAAIDGASQDVFSVNLMQLAVRVPTGASHVLFKYHRPDLSDLFDRLTH